jgi:hypothetical protein
MKRLSLLLSIAAFPLAAVAAEPSAPPTASDGAQWVWCKTDATGHVGAGAPERAELLVSGTSVSGRLLVNDKEYARLAGVITPASANTGDDGATTRVWEITATETMAGGARPPQKLALTGAYTKYQGADTNVGAKNRSYEVFALSKAGGEGASLIISRVQPATPVRVAAR